MRGSLRPKYVLCPGMVTSRSDGQRHYIGPMALAQLYRVNPNECLIYEPAPWWPAGYYRHAEEQHKGLIHLSPRYDGNYEVPTHAQHTRAQPV